MAAPTTTRSYPPPRFVGAVTTLNDATLAVGNRKPRDQIDEILLAQADLTLAFDTGSLSHAMVIGFEAGNETTENRRRLDANGPNLNLFNPAFLGAAPIAYNGARVEIDTESYAIYAFDSVEITSQWIVNLGVRYDSVVTRVQGFDDLSVAPGFVTDLSASDDEISWNAALVYKPIEAASFYLAYGTAFETSGRADIVQVAGGNNNPPVTAAALNVDPEKSESFEAGAKWDLRNGRLSLAAAVFQIEKTNARTPGVNPGDPPTVLDGAQRIRGFEVSAVGAVTPDWNVFAGYTYLDGEVTSSNRAFEVGQRLDNTPRHSLSLWTSYAVTDDLLLGGGVQYVGERNSNIRTSATDNFVITADAYTVVDLFAEYQLTPEANLRLNVYNVADEVYFQSFSSAQSIPSAARSAVLSLTLDL